MRDILGLVVSSVVDIISKDDRSPLDNNFALSSSKDFEALGLPKWYHQLLATLYVDVLPSLK